MKSNFQNNLLLLNDEELLRRIAENLYTAEHEAFAYEVLVNREVNDIEEKVKKIRDEKTLKNFEEADSEKKLNKIFFIAIVVVVCTVATQLYASYKFARESNIFLSLIFFAILFMPLFLAFYKDKLKIIFMVIISSIVIEIISFLIFKNGGWWFSIAWLSSYYIVFKKKSTPQLPS
jgi:hypothetical protein